MTLLSPVTVTRQVNSAMEELRTLLVRSVADLSVFPAHVFGAIVVVRRSKP